MAVWDDVGSIGRGRWVSRVAALVLAGQMRVRDLLVEGRQVVLRWDVVVDGGGR